MDIANQPFRSQHIGISFWDRLTSACVARSLGISYALFLRGLPISSKLQCLGLVPMLVRHVCCGKGISDELMCLAVRLDLL